MRTLAVLILLSTLVAGCATPGATTEPTVEAPTPAVSLSPSPVATPAATPAPTPPPEPPCVTSDEEGAGGWATWSVAPEDIATPVDLGPRPEPVDLQTLSAEDQAAVARWGTPPVTLPWEIVTIQLLENKSATDPTLNPPRISRMLAILETAMFDALVASYHTENCEGRMADQSIVVAATAATILGTFLPNETTNLTALLTDAARSRVISGAASQLEAQAAIVFGNEVATDALALRANDGSTAAWNGTGRVNSTACNWQPTPPAFRGTPLEPMWGHVTPFAVPDVAAIRPAPPPACDGEEYAAQTKAIYDQVINNTDAQKAIARKWAGGGGTSTPPGQNLHLAINASLRHDEGTMRHARTMAHVAAAIADAGIASWDAKFTYWSDRPVTAIRRTLDANWSSLIPTPPFPGYVSGHSTFSGATAQVLSHFFPDEETQCWMDAEEAAMSRFYAGIHIMADNEVGLELGRAVGDAVIERAKNDGA